MCSEVASRCNGALSSLTLATFCAFEHSYTCTWDVAIVNDTQQICPPCTLTWKLKYEDDPSLFASCYTALAGFTSFPNRVNLASSSRLGHISY